MATPFPAMSDFMLAGVSLATAISTKERWPEMSEAARKEIVEYLRVQRAMRSEFNPLTGTPYDDGARH